MKINTQMELFTASCDAVARRDGGALYDYINQVNEWFIDEATRDSLVFSLEILIEGITEMEEF